MNRNGAFSVFFILMSTSKCKVLAAGVVLLLGAAGYAAVGAGFCAATLRVKRLTGPMPAGAMRVEIAARDGAKLVAWWFPSSDSNGGCVAVLHGIGDSKMGSSGFARMFLRAGYSVLAPDSRAHGESGGEFVTYGLLEKFDVANWATWMRMRGCERIYGLGESLGASILIQAAGVSPEFRAIVAESAFADLRDTAEYRLREQLGGGPVKTIVEAGMLYARFADGLDFRDVSPLASIREASARVLLIHGVDDSQTPANQSRLLAAVRPAKDRLWLVPQGGHTDASSVAPAEFRERVLRWFAQ